MIASRAVAAAAALSAAALVVAAAPRTASATKPRLRLERVDARGCRARGVVKVYLAELEIEGVLRSRPDSQYQLLDANDKVVARRPRSAKSFDDTGEPLYLALVVETAAGYCKSMRAIRAGLRKLIEQLPRKTRVTLISYAGEANRLASRASLSQADNALSNLACEHTATAPALIEAIDLALRSLANVPAGARRLIAGISDGTNVVADWNAFRAVASRAASAGVPISFVAYSPSDSRGPLLNLGELGKRTRGTLRWARRRERLAPELSNLGLEISRQRVLTFDMPSRCKRPVKLKVSAGGLTSKPYEVTLRAARAGGGPTARAGSGSGSGARPSKSAGKVRAFLSVLAIAVLVAVLAAVTYLLLRKRE